MNNFLNLSSYLDSLDKTDNSLVAGEERLVYTAFYKRYFNFRNSHITNKFKPLPDDIQLPPNSCLHILNNLYNEERGLLTSDLPNINHPFIKNENFRKYIYHVREPNINKPDSKITVNYKYVYRTMGLDQNLRKFRAEQGDYIKPIYSLDSIFPTPSTLTIINHNPIFRVFVREPLPQYKKFMIIFSSLLNTAAQIENKIQYILLPLGPHVYFKDMFKMAETQIKPTAIRVKNDFHYFLMMHWLNFLNPFSDQSVILKYPKEKWNSTVFVFYYGDYYMFWNLQDIVNINIRNLAYNRIINQFNSLVLTGMGAEVPDNVDEQDIEEKAKETRTPTSGTPDTTEQEQSIKDEEQQIKQEEYAKKVSEDIEAISNNLNGIVNITTTDKSLPDLKYTIIKKPSVTETQADSVEPIEIMTELINNFSVPESVEEAATIENTDTNQDISEETNIATNTYISGDLSNITPITDSNQIADLGTSYMKEIDSKSDALIASQVNLTPKQKERVRRLARAYKNVSIGSNTLEKIISNKVDVKVSNNTVSNLDGYLQDKSMNESSIQSFDTDYMKKLFTKHLAEVAVSMNQHGMFLVGIDESVTADELNRLVTYKLSYEDIRGKRHSVKFTLPLVGEDGICYINGTKQYFRTQMTNLPICKVSPVRVSLSSNYNKTIVERNVVKAHSFLSYLQRIISKINESQPNSIELEYGSVKDTDIKLPYEYAEISNTYRSISLIDKSGAGAKYILGFSYNDRLKNQAVSIPENLIKYITNIETKLNAVFMGVKESGASLQYCFMTQNNIVKIIDSQEKVLLSTTLIDMLISMYDVSSMPRLYEWTDIKILDKKFPVGFLLAYRFGLQYLLKYLGSPYKIIDKPIRLSTLNLRPSDLVIEFQDKYIVTPRYPIRNSLILAGLTMFDLKSWTMDKLEIKDTYHQLLLDKGFKTNYLKGIDDTFDLFIDPITREILIQMNEPTNFKDLLIRATDMVTNNYHKEASSMANHRYRSYERFNAIVYNELSRQFAAYSKKRGAGSTFSLNPNAILLRVIQDQSMLQVDEINPIHDIKTKTGFTYTGMGGRTGESFVINDRRFPKDGVGIISEATADSGNVSITANTPMNPTVANLYGLLESKPLDQLNPTNVLSVSSLVMPGETQDDRYEYELYY